MNDLIQSLTGTLGINPEQAEGGVGLIAKMAQEKLGGDFSKVTDKFPEMAKFMGKAPAAESAGGLGGMMGSAISAMGVGGNLGALASLAGGFKTLGLDPDMITKFAPIVTSYLGDKGGDTIKGLIEKVMK